MSESLFLSVPYSVLTLSVLGCTCFLWCWWDTGRTVLRGMPASELGSGAECYKNVHWATSSVLDLQKCCDSWGLCAGVAMSMRLSMCMVIAGHGWA